MQVTPRRAVFKEVHDAPRKLMSDIFFKLVKDISLALLHTAGCLTRQLDDSENAMLEPFHLGAVACPAGSAGTKLLRLATSPLRLACAAGTKLVALLTRHCAAEW